MRVKVMIQRIVRHLARDNRTHGLAAVVRRALETEDGCYHQLNAKRRAHARVVFHSICEAIRFSLSEELNPEARAVAMRFPKLEHDVPELHPHGDEAMLLRACDDVEVDGRGMRYADPADPLSTLRKLTASPAVLFHYLKDALGLRDMKDFRDLRKRALDPVTEALKNVCGPGYREAFYELVFRVGRLYGIPPLKRYRATDVYEKAYDFYKGHEGQDTLTLSTSSGLFNPLEWYGSDTFIRTYKVPSDQQALVPPKNVFRRQNFRKGVLDESIRCRRIYAWEREGSRRAFRQALALVPRERQQSFLDDAARLFSRALRFQRIVLIEIAQMDEAMRRLTRTGPNEIQFSVRGTESGKIHHALQFRFEPDSVRSRHESMRWLLSALQVGSLWSHPLTVAYVLLLFGEGLVWQCVNKELRRPTTLLDEVMKIGTLIKDDATRMPARRARGVADSFVAGLSS